MWALMALPLAGQPAAQDVLAAARAALGGNKLAVVRSLAIWGPDRRGPQTGMLTLSIDLSGKFLKEQTSFSSGGQVERMGVGEEGAAAASGGMPGDDGGPAMVAGATEGLRGDDYWIRNPGSARVDGNAMEPAAAARKRSFIDSFARYALAFTLSAPVNFPVTFVYASRAEAPGGMADGLEGIGPGDLRRPGRAVVAQRIQAGRRYSLPARSHLGDGRQSDRGISGAAFPHQPGIPAGQVRPAIARGRTAIIANADESGVSGHRSRRCGNARGH
jgi:hypothetical protein